MFNQIKLDIQKLISGKNEVMYMKIKKKKKQAQGNWILQYKHCLLLPPGHTM